MHQTYSTEIAPATKTAIQKAAFLLSQGEVVAFPTETVYGLGADATNTKAVRKIYQAKGRPSFNPLICHFYSLQHAKDEVEFTPIAEALAHKFWPGPLTLVLARKQGGRISAICAKGLDSLAIRIPAHPVAQDLLRAFGKPLAAPSANISGKISPTTSHAVYTELSGRIPFILDAGPSSIGLESTVISLMQDRPLLLRPGTLGRADIESVIGPIDMPKQGEKKISPGMLESHYAPSCPLRLEANEVDADESLLAFGPHPLKGGKQTLNLSPSGDLKEAAANLYTYLRALDQPGTKGIAVMPIPKEGIGEAIHDRLLRAASTQSP